MLKWLNPAKRKQENVENLKDLSSQVTEMPGVTKTAEETVMISEPVLIPENLEVCAASLIGTREYQQDTLWYEGRAKDFLAMVCDGMGGMEGGEKASAAAIEKMEACFLMESIPLKNPSAFLEQAAQLMNRKICSLENEDGKLLDCGTTVVAVYIHENSLYWLSVGDSKIYILRDGKLKCPFLPHNYGIQLNRYLMEGTISEAEYQKEMKRGEALTSYLGMGKLRLCEVSPQPFELIEGDRILLCSDGLYKVFSEEQIVNIMEICKDEFKQTTDVFIQALRDYGKKSMDNVSIICIEYHESR